MLIFRIALLAATSTAFSYTSSTISKSGISSSKSSLSSTVERSQSLPFLNRPLLLDGSMAGDVGFDPLGLSTIDDLSIDLYWLREAEIKHARVAMLAVAGILQVEVFGPAPGCEMATTKVRAISLPFPFQSNPIQYNQYKTNKTPQLNSPQLYSTNQHSAKRTPSGSCGMLTPSTLPRG